MASRTRDDGLLPALLLLLVVLVPTACVVWFMSVAIGNERLAARHKVIESYLSLLGNAKDKMRLELADRTRRAQQMAEVPAPQRFARLVLENCADAALCRDIPPVDDGSQATADYYPCLTPAPATAASTLWEQAERREHLEHQPEQAEPIYRRLAAEAPTANMRARAMTSQVRCLAAAGAEAAADELLQQLCEDPQWAETRDPHGRLLVPSARLLLLERMRRAERDAAQLVQTMQQQLLDYSGPLMPASQRVFLIKRLEEFSPDARLARLREAELLALQTGPGENASASQLRPAAGEGIWQSSVSDGNTVLLWRHETLQKLAAQVVREVAPPDSVAFELLPPGADPTVPALLLPRAGGNMPGWRWALIVRHTDFWDTTARQHNTAYVWTGAVVILAMAVLALVIGRMFRRQMRLAQLKNDLVATVSHELKTPLASMRLLVDTLLHDDQFQPRQVREYLELVAKENTRLTRLIDNFLTFSRMERQKHTLNFRLASAQAIVDEAVQAAGERFHADACHLQVSVASDLPPLWADGDAIVTVLLNLLDNAYKYSQPPREVCLRVDAVQGEVRFAVQDNGAGMPKHAIKRVFEQFYQADQRLSRRWSGCGLGLSIVKFLVTAHLGTVSMESQPGQGSCVRVLLPAATARQEQEHEEHAEWSTSQPFLSSKMTTPSSGA